MSVPFITCEEMLNIQRRTGASICGSWPCAMRARGGISPSSKSLQKMKDIVRTMRASIRRGLEGTQYEDRILGCQSGPFRKQMESGRLLDGGVLNRIILYVTALDGAKARWA